MTRFKNGDIILLSVQREIYDNHKEEQDEKENRIGNSS